jgi:hypothetical protein
MSYPTSDVFRDEISRRDAFDVVQQHILTDQVPYIFEGAPEHFVSLRGHVCRGCAGLVHHPMLQENVTIVGSARIGFSVAPEKFGRPFQPASDVDVLVVYPELFDTIWATILRWWHPKRNSLDAHQRDWLNQRRNDIFSGWFHPDRLATEGVGSEAAMRRIRDIRVAWFNTFRAASRLPGLVGRNVNGRLYRSWDHATLYQMRTIQELRQTL